MRSAVSSLIANSPNTRVSMAKFVLLAICAIVSMLCRSRAEISPAQTPLARAAQWGAAYR